MSDVTGSVFARALVAAGPTADRPQRIHLFGQLVGTWRAELRSFDASAEEWRESVAEWAFAYTLGGRAVQDVLIARDPEDPERLEGRGSTMRVYDSTLGAWRVSWFGAAEGAFCTLVATPHRRDGIRQDGTQTDGRPIRWNFSNITSVLEHHLRLVRVGELGV
ncbi:conserved hypothetical protein [Leifsonia xyli subsp. xyli str. CTCB07]|uniref:DUF1579 domain-containing protein n=1 Tax=Leifsonia xyli subsp. xyli (strain CTCB07) TaxID=281090 RepID=Q6AC72_LEIXX|nr:hypothetical protein [Leifsonia xyli]AAT90020.1 conserved hypothetical protein [Leifsonia xyli subsp. xyli str. CTCB07]